MGDGDSRGSSSPLNLAVYCADAGSVSAKNFGWAGPPTKGAERPGTDAFTESLPDPPSRSIVHEPEVFSLVAAAALSVGWPTAQTLINEPCIVLSADPTAVTWHSPL